MFAFVQSLYKLLAVATFCAVLGTLGCARSESSSDTSSVTYTDKKLNHNFRYMIRAVSEDRFTVSVYEKNARGDFDFEYYQVDRNLLKEYFASRDLLDAYLTLEQIIEEHNLEVVPGEELEEVLLGERVRMVFFETVAFAKQYHLPRYQ
jgi:hypothetical protein